MATVTDSSVDGAVAVARIEAKGSGVVEAWMRSILPVFIRSRASDFGLIMTEICKKKEQVYVFSRIP